MRNFKTLLVLGTAFASLNSFALVCQTDMVTQTNRIINSFVAEAPTESEACRESRKECSKALRLSQRAGQNANASCVLVGLVNPVPPVDDVPPPPPIDPPVGGEYTYQLNAIERDLNSNRWRIRQDAVEQLVRFPVPRSLSMAVITLSDNDRDVKESAKRSITQLIQTMDLEYYKYEVLSSIAPMLTDSKWEVRQEAARVLGSVPTAEAIIPLISAVGDNDRDVQAAARTAIENLKNERDLRLAVRKNRQVLKSLANDNSWLVRQKVMQVIDYSAVRSMIDLVVESMGDNDRDVRNAALSAIRTITATRNYTSISIQKIDKLGQLSTSNSWQVRQQAVFALGETRNYAARTYVLRALDDFDRDVRSAARTAINKL